MMGHGAVGFIRRLEPKHLANLPALGEVQAEDHPEVFFELGDLFEGIGNVLAGTLGGIGEIDEEPAFWALKLGSDPGLELLPDREFRYLRNQIF